MADLQGFRWQAYFQRAEEALFLLDRRGRILFVNPTWETLTGVPAWQARGLLVQRKKATPGADRTQVLAHLLYPPAEVRKGQAGRVRRPAPGGGAAGRWWDIEFSPLADDHHLTGVLGRIRPVAAVPASLPEPLLRLRQRLVHRFAIEELAGRSPFWSRVAHQVRLAGRAGIPVLLVGEPGTGKHWLARALHAVGERREGPFYALDCRCLPPQALTPILFSNSRGTLYLRDPARLPRDLQARLCERLGADEGPQVVAGCGSDPAGEIQSGRLLEELYHALAVVTISLPPLRERTDELPRLVEQFLERTNEDGDRRILGLTPEAWEVVRAYRWPGNLTELLAVLREARLRARGDHIGFSDLPAPLRLAVRLAQTGEAPPERPLNLDRILQEAERRLILLALRRARGNRSRAAEILGIWRPRLLRRMEALGLTVPSGKRLAAPGLELSEETPPLDQAE